MKDFGIRRGFFWTVSLEALLVVVSLDTKYVQYIGKCPLFLFPLPHVVMPWNKSKNGGQGHKDSLCLDNAWFCLSKVTNILHYTHISWSLIWSVIKILNRQKKNAHTHRLFVIISLLKCHVFIRWRIVIYSHLIKFNNDKQPMCMAVIRFRKSELWTLLLLAYNRKVYKFWGETRGLLSKKCKTPYKQIRRINGLKKAMKMQTKFVLAIKQGYELQRGIFSIPKNYELFQIEWGAFETGLKHSNETIKSSVKSEHEGNLLRYVYLH